MYLPENNHFQHANICYIPELNNRFFTRSTC